MTRTHHVYSGDERIERSMDCGFRAMRALPELMLLESVRDSHPEYYKRVLDAKQRILAGEARAAIVAQHGSCVVREALAAILRSAGRGA